MYSRGFWMPNSFINTRISFAKGKSRSYLPFLIDPLSHLCMRTVYSSLYASFLHKWDKWQYLYILFAQCPFAEWVWWLRAKASGFTEVGRVGMYHLPLLLRRLGKIMQYFILLQPSKDYSAYFKEIKLNKS